jgi:hypothetical protein
MMTDCCTTLLYIIHPCQKDESKRWWDTAAKFREYVIHASSIRKHAFFPASKLRDFGNVSEIPGNRNVFPVYKNQVFSLDPLGKKLRYPESLRDSGSLRCFPYRDTFL